MTDSADIARAMYLGVAAWALAASVGTIIVFIFREWLVRRTSLRLATAVIAVPLLALVYGVSKSFLDYIVSQSIRPEVAAPARATEIDLTFTTTFVHPGLMLKLVPLIAMILVWLTAWWLVRDHRHSLGAV